MLSTDPFGQSAKTPRGATIILVPVDPSTRRVESVALKEAEVADIVVFA